MSDNEIRGYADAFEEYHMAGWKSVLWLPRGKKFPPPSGYTGYDATIPSYPDLMAWAEDHPDANLGLRFPAEIVGLDVDAYGEKTGASTIAEALKRYGHLPPTVRSTSRTDPVSGIRLYRKPADIPLHTQIKFPGLTIGNVEVVQDHHRYCVSWPSIHPEGRIYTWRDERGNVVPVPRIDDLPELPASWVEGLRKESHAEITAHRDPFESLRQLPQGRMSDKVSEALERALGELEGEPGSRHDVATTAVLRLLRLAEMGERGVQDALDRLRQKFVRLTADRNTTEEANGEFDRMIFNQRGHDLIASTPSKENDFAVLGVAENIRQAEALAKQRAQENPEPFVEWEPDPANEVSAFLFQEEPAPPPSQPGQSVSAADAFLFGMTPGPVTQVQHPAADEQPGERIHFTDDEPVSMRSRLLSIGELAAVPPSEPLIDGLLYRGTIAQLAGPPGSGKTFVALGMACALASNRTDWNGRDIPWKRNGNSGSVLYVAAEGVSGLYARINAWCSLQGANGIDPRSLELYVYPDAVELSSVVKMEELAELARSLDCVLVVFDTRARCSTAKDENKADEQQGIIGRVEQFRAAVDCTVLLIHHGSRSDGSQPRGSNTWDGAVWSDLRVKTDGPDGCIVVNAHKHKDAPSGLGVDFTYELKPVTVAPELMPGFDEKARSTLVAVTADIRSDNAAVGGLIDVVRNLLETSAVPGDGMSQKDICEALGKPKQAVGAAMRILEKRGSVVSRQRGNGGNVYWIKESED
ncbi:hypothetical protein SEA_JFLIX2_94 [Rhodococcus phage Jflix2]|nr:hypothetical protein SEA_JFLIX2_94 [Rhodococcus phage Jflix2]